MNSIQRVRELGQSLWLDYIRRDLIDSGELERLIQAGEIRGVTSNPTIFEKAIAGSDLYTATLRSLSQAGLDAEQILDVLSIGDIRSAADVFLPLYERTNGQDGFVSIEVNPQLADNTLETLIEARRLWKAINRPNVMIKIPATEAGISAIEQAISEGINVNVTLIFSLDRYNDVMEAYLKGLETRLDAGDSLDHVASVASFFVSRIDTKVDAMLEAVMREEQVEAARAATLIGKIAIASAKLAYVQFKAIFGGPRFRLLAERGARVQRPLWASTSTKNPAYPDTYYIDNLIGPDTVNTLPPQTLDAFRDHGVAEPKLEQDLSVSRAQLEALKAVNISIEAVTDQLEREGVASFANSYISLMKTLRSRARRVRKELGPLLPEAENAFVELSENGVGQRLWEGDPALWTKQSARVQEIRERLGWLTLPQSSREIVDELEAFAKEVRLAGLTKVVLLGMGGSSLAADVIRKTVATKEGMELYVLDSINPDVVRNIARRTPIDRTLFIVASKSGKTIEPLGLMEYFWTRARRNGPDTAGQHFVAITDPGTPLEMLAHERGFRRVFSSPPDVGGRYSALSVFGLLPATLMGINVRALLHAAEQMSKACGPRVEPFHNPGLYLGGLLGAAHRQRRDKLTFVADPGLEPLDEWLEQLIAESSGKEGKGLLPVLGEPPGTAKVYGKDRLLVYLRAEGQLDRRVRGWLRGGVPVVILETGKGEGGLGAAFFQWEVATAVACHLIGVNAFDQPDVQRAKDKTLDLIKTYRKRGSFPEPKALWKAEGIRILGEPRIAPDLRDRSLEEALTLLLGQLGEHESLVFLVYLKQSTALMRRMARVRRALRDRLNITTTLGFGPRYLHSTGQLHKGGPDQAVYLIVTADPRQDLEIPEKGYSFGTLERAQASGDLQALLGLGRRAYRFHLESSAKFYEILDSLSQAIDNV